MFPCVVETGAGTKSVSESENKIADEIEGEEESVEGKVIVDSVVELEVESISISISEFDSIFLKIRKQVLENSGLI